MISVYQIAFASLRGISYRFATDMLARAGSEENFFKVTTQQLKALMGFDNRIFDKDYRDSVLELAKREQQFIADNDIKTFYFSDSESFPLRLAECDDAPILLYALGERNHLNDRHIISIVGTRHATRYGIDFIKELLEEFAVKRPDIVTVSGLAYGIDVAAHRQSIARNIPTVGVLAHGLSSIYPAAHRNIAARMVKSNGMLITDYRHDAVIAKQNFVARNRIVAGLADCTLVVESAEKGGAMITAGIAQGYNRDVFALPGKTCDTYSKGCNRLISRNQAALIQSADDILTLMNWKSEKGKTKEKKLFPELSPDERNILDFLTKEGEGFINRIAVETSIPMHRLMGLLVDMEFKGLIANQPGGLYRLN